jgi:Lactonase, 7-bladed beta-propeller
MPATSSCRCGSTPLPEPHRLTGLPTETTPRGLAIDPRRRFLLAAGLASNALTVSAIDPNGGALASLPQYRLRNAELGRDYRFTLTWPEPRF